MTRGRCPDHPAHWTTGDGTCLATSPPHKPGAVLTEYPFRMTEERPDDAEPGVCIGGFLPPDGGGSDSCTTDEEAKNEPTFEEAAVDTNVATLPRQETLPDEVFPLVKRGDIPMVKLAFAGSVEMTVGRFLELLDGDLEVGAVVECAVTGHFKKLGTGWRKRSEGSGDDKIVWWEKEGLPGIAVDEVGALHITGETWSDE